MNVIAAINGQIAAEVSAFYGLHFARIHGLPLILLHVKNPDDPIEGVEKSMANIERTAAELNQETRRLILEEGPAAETVKSYLLSARSEILFCSSRYRQQKMIFRPSFSQRLAGMMLPVDLAEVRVVHIHSTLATERIVLPIKEDRMSVEKFTFFASMARAYNAGGEIYSVTVTSRKRRADLDLGDTKRILQKIDDRLSHYGQLAKLMAIPLRVKHAVALNEIDQVLHHLAHNDFQLMIVGGERLSAYPAITGPKPLARLLRATPVNTIAFYRRGKSR